MQGELTTFVSGGLTSLSWNTFHLIPLVIFFQQKASETYLEFIHDALPLCSVLKDAKQGEMVLFHMQQNKGRQEVVHQVELLTEAVSNTHNLNI